MILVDTSVWIEHLRKTDARLTALLEEEETLTHPFVVGELACGKLRNRREVLGLLENLPSAPTASDDEVLAFIDNHSLMARGLGYIDVHLLASAALHGSATLWTRDNRLAASAARLRLGF